MASITASKGGRGSPRAGAQQGVDNPGGLAQMAVHTEGVVPIAIDFQRKLRLPHDVKVNARIAGKFFGRRPEQHPHGVAAEVQVSGQDEAVARIVALAAADYDWSGNAQAAQHIGHPPSGVFHEHQPGHAVLLDGPAIDLTRLLAGNPG